MLGRSAVGAGEARGVARAVQAIRRTQVRARRAAALLAPLATLASEPCRPARGAPFDGAEPLWSP